MVALVTLAGAVAVILTLPDRYTATASIEVQPLLADPLAPASPAETTRLDDDRVATEVQQLRARDLAGEVVQKLDLERLPGPPPFWHKLICQDGHRVAGLVTVLERVHGADWLPDAACAAPALPTLSARVSGVLSRLAVEPQQRSRVIDISYTSGDRNEAARVVNTLIETYQARQVAAQTTDASRVVNWVGERTDVLRRRWIEADQAAADFAATNGLAGDLIGTATGGSLVDRRIADAATELSQAQGRLAAAESRVGQIRTASVGNPGSLSSVVENPGLGVAATMLAQLTAQRAQQTVSLGSGHPAVRALDSQIAEVSSRVRQEVVSARRTLESDLAARRAEVETLTRNLDSLRGQAGQGSGAAVRYRTLEREAGSARSVYETFLAREKQLADRVQIIRPPVSFVSHAETPESRTSPQRTKLMLGALVLALTAGAGVAFAADQLARGYSTMRQLRGDVGLPVLGVLPLVRTRRRRLHRYVVDRPFSRAAEAVRTLATGLTLSPALAEREDGHVVVLTSATGAEGKSTTALWLAGTLAQAGQRVLLIDGDHRNGALHRQLGLPADPGLSQFLTGEAAAEEVIRHEPALGIDVITSGGASARALERSATQRLGRLFADLRRHYAMIIIDTPPMLAMSNALVFASLADQTVFICRWRATPRAAVTGCLERLQIVGAHLAGVVVSMMDESRLPEFVEDTTARDRRMLARLYAN